MTGLTVEQIFQDGLFCNKICSEQSLMTEIFVIVDVVNAATVLIGEMLEG
jgi:hypothetical protein